MTEENKNKEQCTIQILIAFLVKLTPYIIGIPILCVVNYMCYEANDRLLYNIVSKLLSILR